MTAVALAFGVALLLAVLTSALADRSPLSSSLVFLAVGVFVGPLVLKVVSTDALTVERAAELALYSILFTDGQHAPWRVIRRAWQAPALALGIGMPLTFVAVALLAHGVVGLSWPAALVVGAVLAPTDPVFASALVGRDEVPHRVRSLLNVESGLNDGLALPAVLLLAGLAGGSPEDWSTHPGVLLLELAVGVALGVALPLVVGAVLRVPGVEAVERLRPLGPVAVAILLFGVCSLVHANQFIAAFVAGSVVASLSPQASESFRHTGELLSELTKGVALLAFATLLDGHVFGLAGVGGLVFAVLVIVLARPIPVLISLLPHRRLTRRERAAVAWFGPKGFASVAYAVIVLSSGMDDAEAVFGLVAVTVLLSVLAHSSSDVAIARWLAQYDDAGEPIERPAGPLDTTA
ncbi:cation:proton antiporter [Nocardioides islandensis]|uniref:Cation:proton antiporter n=1 Tax=Nocardioides islandensis TaxID=433663 RepID=A0A930VD78_9ACTN|nr:cation:proton antiporter [Nocardioides islandensis]MBF4764402.1 cation:proton antiporter [Nocardioides islandensis]